MLVSVNLKCLIKQVLTTTVHYNYGGGVNISYVSDLHILQYCADGKPETKSDSMLVWATHHDPEIDKRSMLFRCSLYLMLSACK